MPAHAEASSTPLARRVALWTWHYIGFICVALVLAYTIAHAFDPPRLNWGDSGSDYNVMIAGRNFARYGFTRLRLTPLLIDLSVMTPADSQMIYTHYPQLPDLANGVMRAVFGMSDIVQFRFVALAFSFASLAFIWSLVASYWSRQTAQVALALWVINPMWIQHADYLHHGPYGAFFGFGSIYFLVRFLRGDRRWPLLASGAFLFLVYCASYDYWIFTPLLLAAVAVAHFGSPFRRGVLMALAPLAACAVAAIACKVATNMWALGGLHPFLKDLHYQSVERTTDAVVHTSFVAGMLPVMFGRIERFFTLLLIPLAIFWAAVPLIRRALDRPLAALNVVNPVVLLLAALPFLALFPELWVAQYYPALMVIPFFAVGFAVVSVVLIASPKSAVKALGIMLLLAVAYGELDEDTTFTRAYFPQSSIELLHAKLDSLAPRGQRVMVNHVFDHAYRYYFDRNVVTLIIHEPFRMGSVIDYFADPIRPQFASPSGALLLQHKRVTAELYDKGYYWILYRYHLWDAWANPPRYRRFIDSLVMQRDSAITAVAARQGTRVFENDDYVLWLIRPTGGSGGPLH